MPPQKKKSRNRSASTSLPITAYFTVHRFTARMYAYAYVHAHTDRQECSVEWKIALGTTRPCYAAFSFFFSARARTFFLVSYVGDTYAR